MDGETIVALISNTGFAIGIATYLVKWVTSQVNNKLNEIVELQRQMVNLQKQLNDLQKQIILIISTNRSGGKSE